MMLINDNGLLGKYQLRQQLILLKYEILQIKKKIIFVFLFSDFFQVACAFYEV